MLKKIFKKLPADYRKFLIRFGWKLFRPFWLNVCVMSEVDTLKYLRQNRASCVLFGDGEFTIMGNLSLKVAYQRKDPVLSKRLKEVFSTRNDRLLICIPEVLDKHKIEKATPQSQIFWKKLIMTSRSFFKEHLDMSYNYGNAQVTRPYIRLVDRSKAKDVFDEFKRCISGRDVVIVEGNQTLFGVGNDLLTSAKSVKRIIGPAKNAFSQYNNLLACCQEQPIDSLFIIALGPAAKPLAFDLFNDRYQALDIGHMDIEYEWFLRKAQTKIPIPGKYVNEVNPPYIPAKDIDLANYKSEIVADFS